MQRTNSQDMLGTREAQLQALLLQGLAGDALAYRAFLAALASRAACKASGTATGTSCVSTRVPERPRRPQATRPVLQNTQFRRA